MSAKITELDENSDPAAGAPGQIFTDFSTQLHSKSTEPQIEDARYELNTNFDTKRAPFGEVAFYININARICNFRTS